MPADFPIVPSSSYDDLRLIRLAREIAMDIREVDDIIKLHGLSVIEFDAIKKNPRFQSLLSSEVVAWQSAINTSERVKLKSGAMIEEWLPELYSRMNDRNEALMAKLKGGELLAKLAGYGVPDVKESNVGDRLTITINLGADKKLEFDAGLPPRVIDHEPNALKDITGGLETVNG
jgi:hypothetical protein